MRAKKKKWNRPELVVLARLKRGENVLAGCKHGTRAGPNKTNCAAGGRCNAITTT